MRGRIRVVCGEPTVEVRCQICGQYAPIDCIAGGACAQCHEELGAEIRIGFRARKVTDLPF